MLTRTRARALLALAVVSAGAVIAFAFMPSGGLFAPDESRSRLRASEAHDESASLKSVRADESIRSAGLAGPPEVDGVESTAPVPKSDAAAFGSIAGFVYDVDGNALAGSTVLFTEDERPEFTSRRLRATTRDDGGFLIEQVPIGTWSAWTVSRATPQDEALIPYGQLDVQERVNHFDFCIHGRCLTGRFTLTDKELDGMTLTLVLLDKLDQTGRPRALAQVWCSKAPPWKQLNEVPQLPDDGTNGVQEEPATFNMGSFSFQGLEPREYILRVSPNAEIEWKGETLPLFVEVPVDLIEFDVELPERGFALDELIAEAVRRRKEGG